MQFYNSLETESIEIEHFLKINWKIQFKDVLNVSRKRIYQTTLTKKVLPVNRVKSVFLTRFVVSFVLNKDILSLIKHTTKVWALYCRPTNDDVFVWIKIVKKIKTEKIKMKKNYQTTLPPSNTTSNTFFLVEK